MKTFLKLGVATVFCGVTAMGCLTAGQKQTANTVLDIAKYSCIVAEAAFPIPEIQTACGIADDLIPAIRAVIADLAQHDAARAAAQASACAPDAGAPSKK